MEFLRSIKLSISQWLMVTMAAIIGGLVLSLRLQGGKLHKAQTDLLKANFDHATEKQDILVANAKDKLNKALKAYRDEP